jgi:ribokinase
MAAKPKVVVAGSANTDFVVRVPQIPAAGETVLGDNFFTARGGKGANQAVAAARLGAEVAFIARLGPDGLGEASLEAYRQEGIDTTYISRDPWEPSGVALIMVSQAGENIIAVAPGANARLSAADIEAAEPAIRQAGCLLLQLEIPIETVEAALRLARRHGVRTILNPAPAASLPQELLNMVDVLTPNESEARRLLSPDEASSPGYTQDDLFEGEELAEHLLSQSGVRSLVITLGARGALVATAEGIRTVSAFPVTPVDSTAAGDAFNGALATRLAEGAGLEEAVRFANAAGALAATGEGAQPSLPERAALEALMASVPGGLR